MPITTKQQWPYPRENENPFYSTFESMVSSIDASVYEGLERSHYVISGGGLISWTAPTLTWAQDIVIYNPVMGFYITIAAGSVNLNSSGDVAYINTTPGQTANLTETVSVSNQLPNQQDYFVIALRAGTDLVLKSGTLLLNGGSVSYSPTYPLPTGLGGTGVASAGAAGLVLTSDGTEWVSERIRLQQLEVTTDTTISSDLPLHVVVGAISANTQITLPAAADGQLIKVSSRSEAGTYLVQIVADGAEGFALPEGYDTSELYLSNAGGTVTLMGVSGAGWYVTAGKDYGVDPRRYGTPFIWLDSRRNVTLAASSRLVTSWGDLSGNGRDVTAAGADRPVIAAINSGYKAVLLAGNYLSRANVSWAANDATIIIGFKGRYDTPYPATGAFGLNATGTTGMGAYISQPTASDWLDGDTIAFGDGFNAGRNPRTVAYVPYTGASSYEYSSHVVAFRLGATASDTYLDGVLLDSRVSGTTAIPNITNQTLEIGRIGADYVNSFLTSFIIYPTALSVGDIQTLSRDMLRQMS